MLQLIRRKGRHVLRGIAERLVQQHVEHGRNADRERDAVFLNPFEEVAVREAPGDMHRQALLEERHQARHLRRVPAERAIFERAVVLGQAEAFERREAVEPICAVVVDHDLRPVGGAGGADDAGEIGRRVALRQALGAHAARHGAEQIVLRVGVRRVRDVAAEADERLAGEQRVAVELLVHEGERPARPQRRDRQ